MTGLVFPGLCMIILLVLMLVALVDRKVPIVYVDYGDPLEYLPTIKEYNGSIDHLVPYYNGLKANTKGLKRYVLQGGNFMDLLEGTFLWIGEKELSPGHSLVVLEKKERKGKYIGLWLGEYKEEQVKKGWAKDILSSFIPDIETNVVAQSAHESILRYTFSTTSYERLMVVGVIKDGERMIQYLPKDELVGAVVFRSEEANG